MSPTVYIIAGPNGAGKTTLASALLPRLPDCKEFLNADLIAAGLSPFAPETQNIRAARLLLTRLRELSIAQTTFGFESTLSGMSYVRTLTALKKKGYRIVLYFLWLPSVEQAIARVRERVEQGGHNIPEADIRRRFSAGLRNFFHLYCPMADRWSLYDASGSANGVVASQEADKLEIMESQLFEQIKIQAGAA